MTIARWIICVSILACQPPCSANAQGFSPDEAVRRMTVAADFEVALVAAEPLVRQPVAIDFDDRGRLWVLQYLQYPNPAGLKRLTVDRFSRTTYDRIPEPPPDGPKGADRLTILEDADGDGRIDSAKDFVSDLNIATGFAFGYSGVFVLQTPYLLFYPDRNRDDIPDGNPDVLLTGFGMEDTSSLANSLVWGPDGWLYGTQGTNLTANIRGIEFEQGLWRYHPKTKAFELFAEGGANMWGLDFDRNGNLLAGTNYGGYLMLHGVQGAYLQKSFAKHGELHNRFAFGYFEHVPHSNFQGGHVTVGGFLYQADAFPQQYRDTYIAVDTLGHAVRWHTVKPNGSTVRSENGGVLLQANDSWFAPSDAVMSPDGAVYIADWYDQRTAHPDPDATWDRSNGRIYRLSAAHAESEPHVDPQSLPDEQLFHWLSSTNEWKVRRARRVLAERADGNSAVRIRQQLEQTADDHQRLQLLWTLYAVGGLDSNLTGSLLNDSFPPIRAWTVRLITDTANEGTTETPAATFREYQDLGQRLVDMARSDSSPVVIRQLASSAQRLPAETGILIAQAITRRPEFQPDPYIPLLTWWAVERHVNSDIQRVLSSFSTSEAWSAPFSRDVIIGRLMRRFAGDGRRIGFAACAQLLASAPDESQRRRMLAELDAGLKMLGRKKLPRLPLPDSRLAIKSLDDREGPGRLDTVPPELADTLTDLWSDQTDDPLVVRIAARLGSTAAFDRAVTLALDAAEPLSLRLAMLEILQEPGDAEFCVEPALKLVSPAEPDQIQRAALPLLARFSDERITLHLLAVYPTLDQPVRDLARDVLLGRAESALAFLREIDHGKYSAQEVTADQLRRLALHNHQDVDALVRKHWGTIRAGTPEEKLAEIRRISNDLRAGSANVGDGRLVFEKHCGLCHRLFGNGNQIGPDLTKANRHDRDYLLVSVVDPSTQIRKEYLNYIVATVDGRIVTGLLAEETQTSVTILGAKNERTTISRDDIEDMQVSSVSLMPENILKQLQPQQIRDLFGYLESEQQKVQQ
ncbi:MAG: c-type cytochrome [Planctomycetaceae bacterium]